jgi:hypothetical protein
MTRSKPPQCDVPKPDHSGPVRPYPCGPRPSQPQQKDQR